MGLYGNVSVGVLLFCCQTLSLLLIGIGVGLWDRIRRRNLFVPSTGPEEIHPFSDALVLAANDGARGAANLCSFVMLFHALLSVMTTFGITQFLSNLLQKIGFSVPIAASLFPQLWEITSGVQSGVQLYAPLSLIVVTTAMGGLCVWCQIFAAVSSLSISKVKFVLSRFLHGLLSLVLFSIGRQWIAVSALSSSDALQASAPITEQFSQAGSTPVTSAICGAVLLVLCIVFLWCAKGKHRKSFP
jgi:hypothetical protein